MAKIRSNAPIIRAFDPIEPSDARSLILGSMPGVASLDAHAYYAHPRNAFWPIMQHLLGEQHESYEDRITLLKQNQVALWDVLKECRRPGSLDADILSDSVVVNNFAALLKRHQKLDIIAFNGKAAEKLFRRYVIKTAEGRTANEAGAHDAAQPALFQPGNGKSDTGGETSEMAAATVACTTRLTVIFFIVER